MCYQQKNPTSVTAQTLPSPPRRARRGAAGSGPAGVREGERGAAPGDARWAISVGTDTAPKPTVSMVYGAAHK